MKTIIISLMVLLMGCSIWEKEENNRIVEKPKTIPKIVIYYISGEIDTIQVPERTCGFMEDPSKIILNDRSCLGYYCKMTTHNQRDAYFNSIACDVKRYELIK